MPSVNCADVRAEIIDRLNHAETLKLNPTERGRLLTAIKERDARGETHGRIAGLSRRLATAVREADKKCPRDVPELEALIEQRLALKRF